MMVTFTSKSTPLCFCILCVPSGMLISLSLLLVQHSLAFLFPIGGGGCHCIPCPPPISCPAGPSCAIPLPCPYETKYVAPTSAGTSYQGFWQTAVPGASYAVPAPAPTTYQKTAQFLAVTPTYQTVQPTYQTLVPASSISYASQDAQQLNPAQPIQPIQTAAAADQYGEGSSEVRQNPTLMPYSEHTQTNAFASDLQQASITARDDSSPGLPSEAPSTESLVPYTETADYTIILEGNDLDVLDNEAHHMQAAATHAENAVDRISTSTSLHSGTNYDPWIEIPLLRRTIITKGLTPIEKYRRRYMILKQIRNARQLSAAVPQTNNTCNSHKLANVMVKVMVDDVMISKRKVLEATEMAFDGEKFDVFCANGEFSYSIHSRKYCEVTKDDTTCFAFR